ncbi:MFS transporter [Amycolatopsis sp. YIM 10]|uniref:MFS transporter n=1 Tax=Amycolatopsis sp. YIM 10 TaxID=2653857 RepID=UPI00129028FB|nr:MFS transporter [Amycolatopsis sp. YIM 10]QFU91623.1 Major Facilitator Superfamily protein [Amycolatopsis sp. YIM 10]
MNRPRLRHNRDFRLLWAGAACSVLGARTTGFLWPVLVIWQGGTPAEAGAVGFLALLPHVLLPVPAGVLVDRWDRRRVLIGSDLVALTAVSSVAAASGGPALAHAMVAAFAAGSAAVVYQLAERAAVRTIVHPDDLSAALSRNEARGRGAGLLGQPTGTALLPIAAWLPYGFAVLTHLLSLGALLRIGHGLRGSTGTSGNFRAELADGLRWLWRQQFLRVAIALIACTNVLFQIVNLALVVAVLGAGGSPLAVGLIGVGAGLGGICGALSGPWWLRRLPLSTLLIGCFTTWALLIPLLALVSGPVALGAVFSAVCFAAGVMNVSGGVYQARITPEHLQGRAGGVAGLLTSGASAGGSAVAGVLLGLSGVDTTVWLVAGVMALLAGLSLASPSIRAAGWAEPRTEKVVIESRGNNG